MCHSMEGALSSDIILETEGLRAHYFCLLFSSGKRGGGEIASLSFYTGTIKNPIGVGPSDSGSCAEFSGGG